MSNSQEYLFEDQNFILFTNDMTTSSLTKRDIKDNCPSIYYLERMTLKPVKTEAIFLQIISSI